MEGGSGSICAAFIAEEKTGTAVIGKFSKLDDSKPKKILGMKGEYENLQKIRTDGFDSSPNYVVRPVRKDERVGLALLEEYIHGKNLNYYSGNVLFHVLVICRSHYDFYLMVSNVPKKAIKTRIMLSPAVTPRAAGTECTIKPSKYCIPGQKIPMERLCQWSLHSSQRMDRTSFT
jgi:hypothetical protein